jgi:hypothetical protein
MSPGGRTRGERGGVLVKILVAVALIALVVAAAVAVAGYLAVRKASQVAQEVAKDPGAKAAEWIMRFNPDLEIARQPDGRYLVRNKKTGEESTVDLTKLKEGKFELKRPGGRDVKIEAGKGGVTVEKDGKVTHLGAAGPAPDWLPLFPGTGGYGTGVGASGLHGVPAEFEGAAVYALTVDGTPDDALAWYREQLGAAGCEVTGPDGYGASGSAGAAAGKMLTARSHDGARVARVFALGGSAGGAKGTQLFIAVNR